MAQTAKECYLTKMKNNMQNREKLSALILVSLSLIGALSTWFSATVILPELSIIADLNDVEKVWLTNGVQLGFVIGALIIAFFNISDIFILTNLIAFCCVIAACANLLLLFSSNGDQIIILRILTGAALAGVYPPSVKLIATWFKTGRGIAMGTIIGALTIGSAFPHLLRALAAETEWEPVIWGSSAATFFAGIVFAFLVREGPFAFARTKFDPTQIFQVVRNRALALVNIGYLGHMWELYAMWAWFLTFARLSSHKFETFPLNSPEYLSFTVVSAGGLGCIVAGYLSDIYGRCLTTAGLMLTSGLCAFFIGFSVDLSAFIFTLIAIIWGATIIADSGQFSAAVTELSDQKLVGTALTFQMAIGFGITILAVWLVPTVAKNLDNFQWAFLILVPGPFIGALAMLTLRRKPEALLLASGKR